MTYNAIEKRIAALEKQHKPAPEDVPFVYLPYKDGQAESSRGTGGVRFYRPETMPAPARNVPVQAVP
jgi:hypothetical protein